jgi:hypothetical protein
MARIDLPDLCPDLGCYRHPQGSRACLSWLIRPPQTLVLDAAFEKYALCHARRPVAARRLIQFFSRCGVDGGDVLIADQFVEVLDAGCFYLMEMVELDLEFAG